MGQTHSLLFGTHTLVGEMPMSEEIGVTVEGDAESGKTDQAGQGMECPGDFSTGQKELLQGSDI